MALFDKKQIHEYFKERMLLRELASDKDKCLLKIMLEIDYMSGENKYEVWMYILENL